MISISAMRGGVGEYYLNLAREDYYHAGGEPPGNWIGLGCLALELSGTVEKEELRTLLSGHTQQGEKLVRSAGTERHRAGWDLTFSAPKTVSVVWSQADPETRAVIQDAQRKAVAAAINYLEKNAAFTRTGKGGENLEPVRLTVATFEHGTSRAKDPQLHTHALVLNCGVRKDGSTGTLQSRYLFQHQMAAGALYRAELAKELEERLSLVAERKKSWFELKGVSKELTEEFSKRRAEVEERLTSLGLQSAKAAEVAALDTRTRKEEVSREELFRSWQKLGLEQGFSEKEVTNLTQQKVPKRNPESALQVAIEEGVKRLTQHASHFAKRELVRVVAEEAQGRGVGATAVQNICERYFAHAPELVFLGEQKGEQRYTTKEIVERERRLLDKTQNSLSNSSHIVSEQILERILRKRSTISDEQRAALLHVTRSTSAISVISGMAGTGKTFLLDAAREAWTLAGLRVNGLTLAGKAAQGLEEGAGITSDTIHSTLQRINRGDLRLTKRDVLVLDEAGMVGTRQLEEIVTHVDRAGAKLVLVGDSKQLQPVDAGGPFAAIAKRIGQAELKDIRRQKDDWAREAVTQFATGNADTALTEYAKRGFVTVTGNRILAKAELISAWKGQGISSPAKNLIIAGANLEADDLNKLAQGARKLAGVLGESSATIEGTKFHQGDRVLFTRNSKMFGVKNGNLGTITRIEKHTVYIQLDSEKEVKLSPTKYPHLKLGYAITTHKGQGVTVDNAFILAGGAMQDRELTYVQASRARGQTKFFVDKLEAGEELTDLVRSMKRSRMKDLAHDISANPTPVTKLQVKRNPEITLGESL